MADHQIDVTDQKALKRRAATESGPTTDTGPAHPLLTLQSQVGNAHIARMLAQRAADEDEMAAKHDTSLQRAGEEDEMAAKHDDEHVGIEGGPVGSDTAQRIDASRGGGSSLDGGLRSQMESSMGADFGDVRVHHDSESDMLNRRVTAKAFTTGSDIYLRSDSSPSDSHLMAHELTHVVQQRSGSVNNGSGMTVGAAGDSHEQHADSVANAVTTAAPAAVGASHDMQRAGEEDELAATHDTSMQRAGEEDELAATHDTSVQRAGEEDELAATHDTSMQRAGEEDEMAQ